MTHLRCAVGAMGVTAPQFPLRLAAQAVEGFFSAASTGTGGNPSVDIQFEGVTTVSGFGANPVSAFDLHNTLRTLIGNPPAGQKVDRIGLLFAHSYQPRDTLFGLMFDRGFATSDDPNAASLFTGVPRQGCAVFLRAIAASRQLQPAIDAEIAFTAVHEMGHVFNLGHVGAPRCFMSQSQDVVAPPETFIFTDDHRERLQRGITSDNVWPGGSRFGDLGHLPPEVGEAFNEPGAFGLELRLDMSQREFHVWEPVELEIRLGLASGVNRTFTVPDILDPGYEFFDIWIERPNGERVKYRPCNYYCINPRLVHVTPKKPFERDLSIFGQSGGYTFRHAGVHRISAELRLPGQGIVRSGALEVNVLPQPFKGRLATLEKRLSRFSSSRILFYRNGLRSEPGIAMLEEVCERFAAEPSAAASHYALGRFFFRHAQRASRREISGLQSAARNHLDRAVEHDRLSYHRRDLAARLLDEIPRPRSRRKTEPA